MVNQKIISKNFSDASQNYNQLALLQKNCATNLFNFSKKFINKNNAILDLGSGTSFIAKNIVLENNNQKIFEVDLSIKMLQNWQERPINSCAIASDINYLPFKNQQIFDIVFSSFALQWIDNFDKLFASLQIIVKNGGILAFCLPTKNSLSSLKLASVESGCDFNIKNLPDENYLRQKFNEYNFEEIFFFQENILQKHKNAVDVLKNIKQIGAGYLENKNFINKNKLQKFNDLFLINSDNNANWTINYFIFKKL